MLGRYYFHLPDHYDWGGFLIKNIHMEIIINKIYETIFFKDSTLSNKERTLAVLIGLGPSIVVFLYFSILLFYNY